MSRIAPFIGLSLLAAGLPAAAHRVKPPEKINANVLLNKQGKKADPTNPKESQGVIWKFGWEKGRVTKFSGKVILAGNSAEGEGFSVEIKNLLTETVKDVSKAGDGTVESRTEVGEVTLDGQPLTESAPNLSGSVTTSVFGANGLLVKRTPSQTSANIEAINKVASIALSMPTPTQPVKPGDEWKTEITNPFLPDQKVVVTSQYEDQSKFGTMLVYRVRLSAIVSVREDDAENADAVQVNGYYEFEPIKQRVVKSDITIDNLDIEFRGKKARVSVEAILAMIGIPDQITPRTIKKKK